LGFRLSSLPFRMANVPLEGLAYSAARADALSRLAALAAAERERADEVLTAAILSLHTSSKEKPTQAVLDQAVKLAAGWLRSKETSAQDSKPPAVTQPGPGPVFVDLAARAKARATQIATAS
jgi:hypothetical protein